MTTEINALKQSMTGRFSVSSGPGKWDLFVGLGENTANDPHTVLFRIEAKMATSPQNSQYAALMMVWVEVCLNSLAREDGSGQRWLFEGYNLHSHQNVKGYLNLHDRTGWLEFVS